MQLSKGKTIEYTPDPNKFDLVTHRWDGAGNLVHKNTYRKFIVDKSEYYERPVGSGNLWTEGNQPAGRVLYQLNEKGHICDKTFDFKAPHKQYTPPSTAKELSSELLETQAKLAAAQAELAAIQKEREAKQSAAPVAEQAEPAKPRAQPTLTKRS